MLTSIFSSRLLRFARDDRAYVSTEAVIVLPAMMWLFGVGWTYFDAFHQQSINQKANYVIGDMLSRETRDITGDYMTNTFNLLTTLAKSDANSTDMRISVVQYDANTPDWSLVWSSQRGATLAGSNSYLTDADLVAYSSRLPPAMHHEQLVIVETWEDWEPAFDVGLGAFEIKTYSFTSPRFAPQIPFDAATATANDHVATPTNSIESAAPTELAAVTMP